MSWHNSLRRITSCFSFWYNNQLIAQLVGRHEDLFNPKTSCLPRDSSWSTWSFLNEQFSMSPAKLGNKRLRFSFSVQFNCTSIFKEKTNICNSLRKIVSFGQQTTIQTVFQNILVYAILQVAYLLTRISLRMDAPISTTTKAGCSEVTTVQTWRRWRHTSSGMLSDWDTLANQVHWWRHITKDSTHSLNSIMMTLKAFKSYMVSNYEVLIIQYSKENYVSNYYW